MCEINRIDPRIVSMGLNIIGKLIEGELSEQPSSSDILGTATTAYQQGKITKAQYLAVIDALDENTTVQTTARVEKVEYCQVPSLCLGGLYGSPQEFSN